MSLKVDIETKIDSEPCLLSWSDALFVGCEDGSIKSFDSSLKPLASWKAHEVQPFALEAGGGRVYSASNDGGVKIWGAKGDKITELPSTGADIGTLRLDADSRLLYAGDEYGMVTVYENETLKAKYSVIEEVKDILLHWPYMMTGRDLDVTVTQIKPDASMFQFMTKHTMEGRPPLRLAGTKLLLVSRDGRALRVHENSMETKYKMILEQQASVMIITSVATDPNGRIVWSSGWDGQIKRWILGDTSLTLQGEVSLGACVNALVTSKENETVYAAVSDGKLVKITYA